MITIYTKDKCGFCFRAKELLVNKGIPFSELKLDVDYTRETLLESYPNARTYPVIVAGDEFVGGYEDLLERINKGDTFTQVQLNG